MKYVSKIDVEVLDGVHLIKGKLYEIEEGPVSYNDEWKEVKTYIVLGEKGWFKTDIDNFISLEELREKKLNDLGI